MRCVYDDGPHQQGIYQSHGGHGGAGLKDFFRPGCAVIIADDRRRAFGDGVDRGFNHLAYAGNDGHDGDIKIAAGDGQYVITADGYNTVGQLHDESGCAEADDVGGFFPAGGQLFSGQQTDFVFGSAAQKVQHKQGRECL